MPMRLKQGATGERNEGTNPYPTGRTAGTEPGAIPLHGCKVTPCCRDVQQRVLRPARRDNNNNNNNDNAPGPGRAGQVLSNSILRHEDRLWRLGPACRVRGASGRGSLRRGARPQGGGCPEGSRWKGSRSRAFRSIRPICLRAPLLTREGPEVLRTQNWPRRPSKLEGGVGER